MNHQSSFSLRSFFQPVDLTQGTCWKTLLVFAFPIIVSYLLQQVYSISDAAIVGQTLTASEVAGVNDTTSLAMIFLQFARDLLNRYDMVVILQNHLNDMCESEKPFTIPEAGTEPPASGTGDGTPSEPAAKPVGGAAA